MEIEEILKKHENELMNLPNVISVGLGEKNGKEVIIVFVKEKIPELRLDKSAVIPKMIEGFETDVRKEIRVG